MRKNKGYADSLYTNYIMASYKKWIENYSRFLTRRLLTYRQPSQTFSSQLTSSQQNLYINYHTLPAYQGELAVTTNKLQLLPTYTTTTYLPSFFIEYLTLNCCANYCCCCHPQGQYRWMIIISLAPSSEGLCLSIQ